jgi:hypothetical protein
MAEEFERFGREEAGAERAESIAKVVRACNAETQSWNELVRNERALACAGD